MTKEEIEEFDIALARQKKEADTMQSPRNSNTTEDEDKRIEEFDIALAKQKLKKKEAYNEELNRPVLSASFGDASDSALLINKEDLTDEELPDWIGELYNNNTYKGQDTFAENGYKHNIKLLEDHRGTLTPFDAKHGDIDNEIERLKYEQANQIETERNQPASSYRETNDKIKDVDNKIEAILNDPSLTEDQKLAFLARKDEDKKQIVNDLPSFQKNRYNESKLIIENIKKTEDDEANSSGFEIFSNNENENIKLNEALENEIINQIHNGNRRNKVRLIGTEDEAVTATMGLEHKEQIINDAKISVLKTAGTQIEKDMDRLTNDLYSKYDSEEELTEEDIEQYSAQAEEIEDRYANVAAQYDFSLAEGIFTKDNFQTTTEFREWRDKKIEDGDSWAIAGDNVATLGQGLRDFGTEYLYGTASMANRVLLYGMTKAGVDTASAYDRLNFMDDLVDSSFLKNNTFGTSDVGGSLSGENFSLTDFSTYNVTTRSVFKTLSVMGPFTIALAASVRKGDFNKLKDVYKMFGKNKTGLKYGNVGITVPNIKIGGKTLLKGGKKTVGDIGMNTVRMGVTAHFGTVRDNYQEGIDMGLDEGQALAYGNMASFATAVVQGIMPDANFFNTKAGVSLLKAFKGELSKASTKAAIKRVTKQFADNLVGEIGEEEMELFFTDLAKVSVGLTNHTGFLDAQVQFETLAGTLILSGTTSATTATAGGMYKNIKSQVYSEMKANLNPVIEGLIEKRKEAEDIYNRAKLRGPKFQNLADRAKSDMEAAEKALKHGRDIKNAITLGGEFVTDAEIDLFIEKAKLLAAKGEMNGKPTVIVDLSQLSGTSSTFEGDLEGINERIKEIDALIKDGGVEKNKEEITKKTEESSVKVAKALGIDTTSFEDDASDVINGKTADQKVKDRIDAINNTLPTRNKGKKDDEKDKEVNVKRVGDNGFIIQYKDGTQEIIVNKTKSKANNETTVAQHEILHSVLKETLTKNPKAAQGLAKGLKGYVDAMIDQGYEPSAYLNMKLSSYQDQSADVQAEEMLTFFSDGMSQGYLKFDESVFSPLKDVFRQTLQNAGLKKIKFNTGRDVFNFIKDYNQSMGKGKGLKGSLLNVAKKGATGSLVNGLGAQGALERKVNTSFENQGKGYGTEIVNAYTPYIKMFINKGDKSLYRDASFVAKVRSMQSQVLEIVKNHKLSDKTTLTDKIGRLFGPIGTDSNTKSNRSLYDRTEEIMGLTEGMTAEERVARIQSIPPREKTRLGQLVGYEYTNEVNRKLRKFNNVIGFNKEKENILADITYATTKEGKRGSEIKVQGIVNIVERYSGEIELNRWINGQLDNKIQGIVESYNLGIEVEGFSDSSGKGRSINKGRYTNIIKTNAVPSFAILELKEGVRRIARVLKTSVFKETSKNKTIAPWVREFIKGVGKQNDIVFKKLMGGLVRGKFSNYLLKNKKTILENMTTSYLSKSIPGAISKKVNGKFTTDWKGQKIDLESSAETGRASGLEVMKRNLNITDQEFLSTFGEVKVDPRGGALTLKNIKRGTKESLAKAMAEETGLELLANDADIFREFVKNQDHLNIVEASIDILDIGRDIERGNSKSNKSAAEVQQALFEMMDQAILEGGSSDNYLMYKSEQPKDIQAYADEIGLDQYFDEGKTGYKKPLLEWNDMPLLFKPATEVYKRTITNKKKGESMEQLADFSEAMIDVLPPELVRALGPDMFSITYSYLDGAAKKKDTGLPGPYNYLAEKVIKKGKETSNTVLPFNPADISRFNSGSGVMKAITTILKRGTNKDGSIHTAAQKRAEVQEKFGDIIDKAEIANIAALRYIIEEGLKVIAKNPSLAPGFMRWLESSTSNVQGQRALTRLPLIQYIDGSMEADKTHVYYEQAKEFAIARSTAMYKKLSDKDKSKKSLKEFIEERLIKHPPEEHLKFKGEHVDPAANVMLKLAQVALKTAAKIHAKGLLNKPKLLRAVMSYAGLEIDAILSTYDQTLGAKLFSDIQDDALSTTSTAGDFRGLTVDTDTYNTFLTSEGIQAIEYIKRSNLSIEGIEKVISETDVDNYISNQNKRDARDSALSADKETKGISVFDFDDTLAQTKSNVLYTLPDGSKGSINATQFAAESGALETQGAKFDFSEFSKVIDGKKGPLADLALKRQDKFGNKDIFVLTARPQASAVAIQQFLKEIGLDVKISNITGLENGDPQAKADWIVGKAAEGFNDFYFADDAMKNVKAVQDALSVLDVKGDVQQAIVKSNKSLSTDFNAMLENSRGVKARKKYSRATGKLDGKKKGKFRFFLPPSAEDFMGLMYNFMGKGKVGDAHKKFFEDKLLKPYARGVAEIERANKKIQDTYRNLKDKYEDVGEKLLVNIPGSKYTWDQAIRVYLYVKSGHEFDSTELSKTDVRNLKRFVNKDKRVKEFADSIGLLTNIKGADTNPGEHWLTRTIESDLSDITERVGRKEYLKEFLDNSEIVFTPQNLNKIEAIYGRKFRTALEDILARMKTGVNRKGGTDENATRWTDWVNNSVGTIMFLNIKSAVLQLTSTINFLNHTDNHPGKAGLALANLPQYKKDFFLIFYSAKLTERRSGLKQDINAADIAKEFDKSNAKFTPRAILNWFLTKGFLPTQIADSVAIAFGGAAFYRNRTNTYIKEGMSVKDAEAKAWEDFSLISEETQQSSDPSLISQDQAGPLGRTILAFANTPMQYNRIIKKAFSDLINKRGDWKTNVRKILHYGFLQNFIFSAMQQVVLGMAFQREDDELLNPCKNIVDDKAREKCEKKEWLDPLGHSMLNTVLRGAGLYGAITAALKDTVREFAKQSKVDKLGMLDEGEEGRANHGKTLVKVLSVSPPMSSKAQKLLSAFDTWEYKETQDIIDYEFKEGGTTSLRSPTLKMAGDVISATTNAPLDRFIKILNQLYTWTDDRNSNWTNTAIMFGWSPYAVNANDAKELYQERIKNDRWEKASEPGKFLIKFQEFKDEMNMEEQKIMLKNALGLTKSQINKLKNEDGRCKKLAKWWMNTNYVDQKKEAAKTAENKN